MPPGTVCIHFLYIVMTPFDRSPVHPGASGQTARSVEAPAGKVWLQVPRLGLRQQPPPDSGPGAPGHRVQHVRGQCQGNTGNHTRQLLAEGSRAGGREGDEEAASWKKDCGGSTERNAQG